MLTSCSECPTLFVDAETVRIQAALWQRRTCLPRTLCLCKDTSHIASNAAL
jgi:hypothetical protein